MEAEKKVEEWEEKWNFVVPKYKANLDKYK